MSKVEGLLVEYELPAKRHRRDRQRGMTDQAAGARIGEDAVDLDHREPHIQRHHDHSELGAGVDQLKVIGPVRHQDSQAVAGPEAVSTERAGNTGNAMIQFRERQPPVARPERRAVRKQLRGAAQRARVDHRVRPQATAGIGRGVETAPPARKSSISAEANPSSLRTSSVCSPSSGARFAGILATPCTCIGLLIVEVSLSPAPSSGTTMSFARSCGSLMTSLGPFTSPKVRCACSKTSRQCAIGWAVNAASRMPVSSAALAAASAGSLKRGSVRRSARPIAFANAATLSGVTSSTNQWSSALL